MYTPRRKSMMQQRAQRSSSGAFVFGSSSWWLKCDENEQACMQAAERRAKICKNAYASRSINSWRDNSRKKKRERRVEDEAGPLATVP